MRALGEKTPPPSLFVMLPICNRNIPSRPPTIARAHLYTPGHHRSHRTTSRGLHDYKLPFARSGYTSSAAVPPSYKIIPYTTGCTRNSPSAPPPVLQLIEQVIPISILIDHPHRTSRICSKQACLTTCVCLAYLHLKPQPSPTSQRYQTETKNRTRTLNRGAETGFRGFGKRTRLPDPCRRLGQHSVRQDRLGILLGDTVFYIRIMALVYMLLL